MRLVLDSDWFTPAPDGVYMVRCGGQIKFVLVWARGGGRLTRPVILARRRCEGITTPIWVIDCKMGRDELQAGNEDDGNGQHDER